MFVFTFKLLVHNLLPTEPEYPQKLCTISISILCAFCYGYCKKESQQRPERNINIEHVMMPRPPTASVALSAPVVLQVALPPDEAIVAASAPPPPYEEPPPYHTRTVHKEQPQPQLY